MPDLFTASSTGAQVPLSKVRAQGLSKGGVLSLRRRSSGDGRAMKVAPLLGPGACCGHFPLVQAGQAAARPSWGLSGGPCSHTRQKAAGSLPHLGSCWSSKAHALALEGRGMELPRGRFVKPLQWSLLTETINTPASPALASRCCEGVRETDGCGLARPGQARQIYMTGRW